MEGDRAVDAPAQVEEEPSAERRAGTTAEKLVAIALVVLGVRLGLRPLSDNSFFTHLSTGRIILDQHSVPTTDPYSYTAHGEPWTVQSWFASVVYATAEELAGFEGMRLVVTVLVIAVLLTVWRSSRPAGGLVARLATIAFVLAIGALYWSERPLLFGLLGLVLVLRAAADDLDPRWLVPIMWVWVNSHGSFPFAPAVLVLLALGRRLDGGDPKVELRALGWTIVGLVAACVNPLGPRLLAFPVAMLERREAFGYVVEWKPIDPSTVAGTIFLAQLAVAAAFVLFRHRRWRVVLPLVAFAAAAIMSRRNIVQANVVLAFVMAPALAGLGRLSADVRRPVFGPAAGVLGVVAALLLVFGLTGPNAELDRYPVAVLDRAEDEDLLGPESRLLVPDFAGGYVHVRFGAEGARVFVDDRVDMYPLPVIRDLVTLRADGSEDGFEAVFERRDPTVVAWEEDSGVGRWLSASDDWKVVEAADGWLLAVPAQ